jgi:hypothetical protein
MKKNTTKGYKCFNKDFTCNNFKFKVGKTYKHDGPVELCKSGFHFCKEPNNVFNYYTFTSDNHVCEIEAIGEVLGEGDKSVCGTIKIIRELSWDEVLKISNLGQNNFGHSNAGSYNAGHSNAGHSNAGSRNAGNDNAGHSNAGSRNAGNDNAGSYNAGSRNAGNDNAGSRNAGSRNAGNDNAGSYNAGNDNAGNDNAGSYNAGSRNAGNDNAGSYNAGNDNAGSYNAGSYNAGSRNAGSYNVGNDNAGLFNSNPGRLRLFNKETKVKWEDPRIQAVIRHSPTFQEYVNFSNMTDLEKTNNPYAKFAGGYFRQLEYKDAWIKFWGNAQESVKKAFLDLPNFDKKVFLEITGIKV